MEAEKNSESESSKSSKEKSKERLSVRFHLQLADSTDRSFPQFSYLELLGSEKNKGKDEDILQDGECNVDEIRALAKKFEDKYGPKSATKKSKGHKSDRVQDLVDVTYGYDVTDSFVDDSEAYDELVPADWTTEHGGFYINMGELNFRPVSSGDEKSDGDFKESKKKKTPKKKNKENKEKKVRDGKRHLSSGEKEKSSKKMKLNSNEKDGKQRVKKQKSVDGKSTKDATQETTSQQEKRKPNKLLSIENMNLQSPMIKLEKNSLTDLQDSVSNVSNSSTGLVTSNGSKESDSNSPSVTLPDGLPPSLILSVQKLIEAARKAGGEAGKCKFFNSDVNRILLQIETDSRKLNCRARSAVYDYLALFLPCTKDTLLKRAKNLFMQEQVGRLREPLHKLRLAIEGAMPAQVKNYEEEVAKLSEDQAAQSQKSSSDTANQNGEKKDDIVIKDVEVDAETDKTEESCTPTDVNAPTTPNEDKGKRAIFPKRFVWKDDIRNLLCDVVSIKVELYLMSKSRSTTAEEALKGFLETEVRPIWPKGWMTTRILYRESKQAHAKVTSTIVAKAKKDVKRPKEDEGKSLEKNQQVAAMVVAQKNSEETRSTSVACSDASDVKPILKTAGPLNPQTLFADKQTSQLESATQSKPDVGASVEFPVDVHSQTKSLENSLVMNFTQAEGASMTQHELVGCTKYQNETQLKVQMSTSVTSELQGSNKSIFSSGMSSQDTPESQTSEKSQLQVKVISQTESREQSHDPPNACNSGIAPSFHDQTLSKSPIELGDQSLIETTSNVQNVSEVHDEVQPHSKEESSLRKLLGLAEARNSEPMHLPHHLQNQSSVSVQPVSQIQGQTHLHAHRAVVQNKPFGQSQKAGKGRVQALPHNQAQLKSPIYLQNQLEPQSRIQNQMQSLSFPASQIRGQLQGRFHSSPHQDSQVHISPNNHRTQVSAISFSSPTNMPKPKPTKTILDFLDDATSLNHPSCNTSPQFHSPESRSLSQTTPSLSSCSFQNQQRLDQISPPRNVKAQNKMSVPSPPRSVPKGHPVRNVSPIRQMSNSTGTFSLSNISSPKRLSSCSLQNLPAALNQETPLSPRSPARQGYNYVNKVPSSPNLSCQFPIQPSRSSPESHQRNLKTLGSSFMPLPSSSNTQLTATSLLNSLANLSQNHMSLNSPSVGQSHPIPHQSNGLSMTNNPLSISTMMQNNIPNNKPPGQVLPDNMKNFSGLPAHQYPNQPPMHRNNLPTSTELSDGNNRNYQSPYRPFS